MSDDDLNDLLKKNMLEKQLSASDLHSWADDSDVPARFRGGSEGSEESEVAGADTTAFWKDALLHHGMPEDQRGPAEKLVPADPNGPIPDYQYPAWWMYPEGSTGDRASYYNAPGTRDYPSPHLARKQSEIRI